MAFRGKSSFSYSGVFVLHLVSPRGCRGLALIIRSVLKCTGIGTRKEHKARHSEGSSERAGSSGGSRHNRHVYVTLGYEYTVMFGNGTSGSQNGSNANLLVRTGCCLRPSQRVSPRVMQFSSSPPKLSWKKRLAALPACPA